jgi:hypothetical protein
LYGGDRTPGRAESISAQSCDVVLENDDEPKEWMAQVEPGVHITFVSLPNGGNDLKRIRFRCVSVIFNNLSFSSKQIKMNYKKKLENPCNRVLQVNRKEITIA